VTKPQPRLTKPQSRPKPRDKAAPFDLDEEDSGPWMLPQDFVSRTLVLMGDVEEPRVEMVLSGLFRLAEMDMLSPIYLVVSTQGGNVDEVMALYDAIQMCPAPVRTIGLGKVMSAGCLLLAAGQKGERRMGRNSRLMYHAAYEVTSGDIFQQEVNLTEFKRMEKAYDNLVAKETGKTIKQVEALYQRQRMDRYLTAQEALAFGFVDKLV